MMVNVFGSMDIDRYSRIGDFTDVKLHNYGKPPRAGRKVGHVTATGDDVAEVAARVSPEQSSKLLRLVDAGTISHSIAKDVWEKIFQTGRSAEDIVYHILD